MIQLDPKYAIAYINRGAAYATRATTTAPSRTTTRRSSSIRNTPLPTTTAAIAYASKGDYDRAIADYDQAIQLDPKNAFAYNNRGNAYCEQGRLRPRHRRLRPGDPARSEICRCLQQPRQRLPEQEVTTTAPSQDYDQAIQLDPKYANAYTTAASPTAPRATTTAPSRTTTRRSSSIRNTPSPSTTAASPTPTRGDYDRAIQDYDQAIQLDPKYANAYSNRGDAYYTKGDYDRAIQDYDQAIKLDPKYADAYQQPRQRLLTQGRPRPRHRRLRPGDPARSDKCQRLRQPRPRLLLQGQLQGRGGCLAARERA